VLDRTARTLEAEMRIGAPVVSLPILQTAFDDWHFSLNLIELAQVIKIF
jgi:hypothetical protein